MRSVCLFTWMLVVAAPAWAVADTDQDGAMLQAVVEYADNVLRLGRDADTPLFADGLHVDTRQPAEFDGWVLSNLADQQNLVRVLTGLTRLTGDPRYTDAAREAITWHFERQHPSGLLNWGHHRLIDLRTHEVVGDSGRVHELKMNFPFYELMWKVDTEATERFLRGFWARHVADFRTLNFNRHGSFSGGDPGDIWDREFAGPEPFYATGNLTFINTGADLIQAAAVLSKYSGDERPLDWALRMAGMFRKTRHPETRLTAYQFTRRDPDRGVQQFGEDLGDRALEGKILVRYKGETIYGYVAVLRMRLAEELGDAGEELLQWAHDDLLAYARYAYDPETHTLRPLLTDGTDLTGYRLKRGGYHGRAGAVFEPWEAGSIHLLAYALGYRLTGDAALWETTRAMARGQGLGELGRTPGHAARLNLETGNADPHALLALLELHRAGGGSDYLDLATRIGENILAKKFHRGFFLHSEDHVVASFNSLEPLALLSLEAARRGAPEAVPAYNGGGDYMHMRINRAAAQTR